MKVSLVRVAMLLMLFPFALKAEAQGLGAPMSQVEVIRHLAEERAHYLDGFRASYKAWCSEKAGVCAAELLMRPNNLPWPEPYAQIRLDMVSNQHGKFEASRYEHELPAKALATPRAAMTGRLKINLHSVVWNRIEFRSVAAPVTLAPLSAWVTKWLDLQDSRALGPDQLAGVIHSTTFPTNRSGVWQFMVDFGSAPVTAFEELLLTLEQMGVREVSIGSFSPIQ
jgi:hypothetical protein